MRVGDVIVAGILARREHAAQRVTLVHRPRDDEHIRMGQRAVAAAAGLWSGLGLQSLRPWNVGEPRQPGRRAEGQEIPASGRLGVEINDLALKILGRRRLCCRRRKGKGRGGRRLRDRIETKISLNPFAIDSHHALLRPRRYPPLDVIAWTKAVYNVSLRKTTNKPNVDLPGGEPH